MAVYKDEKRNTWYVSLYYTDWNGTKKKLFKRGFETKDEALQFEHDFIARINKKSSIKFGKIVEYYLDDMKQRVRPTTFQTKQYVINDKILPYFKDMSIGMITANDIRRWQDDLIRRGYADTYLRTIHEQLSAVMNYAVKYYDLPKNPCLAAGSMGKGTASEMEIWTLEEFHQFMGVMEDRPMCYMAFLILFWTGLRLGEMLGLTIADIDLVNRTVRVNKSLQRIHGYDIITEPKTPKSNRLVSMPQLLADKLEKYIANMGASNPEARIVPLSRTVLGREFKRGIRRSGVKDIHIHCLRHSYTALIASLGASPVEAAERLGHENVKTTLNIYSHVLPGRQQAISDELDKLDQRYEDSMKQKEPDDTDHKGDGDDSEE